VRKNKNLRLFIKIILKLFFPYYKGEKMETRGLIGGGKEGEKKGILLSVLSLLDLQNGFLVSFNISFDKI